MAEFFQEEFSIRHAQELAEQTKNKLQTPGGSLSREQLLRAAQAHSLTISPIANKQFDSLDADGDGYITVADLKHVLCIPLEEDKLEEMLKEIDESGTGKIDRTTFKEAMMKQLKPPALSTIDENEVEEELSFEKKVQQVGSKGGPGFFGSE